jgi:hypothetical protein
MHKQIVTLFLCIAASSGVLFAQNAAVTVNVDAIANRHTISPLIYGTAFATTAQLNELNATVNRQGGNGETRYNWQANGSNRAVDYFFESIGENSATAGEHADTFISDTHAAGAQPMITVPMIGWVAKLAPGRNKLASFSVAKYGAQQQTDQFMPDAGNGITPGGANVTGNDPNDANMAADSAFQLSWFQHLVSTWGTAANGGLRYYMLDNEHSIWHSSHRDVHPTGATMDEIATKMCDYSDRIKSVDPNAQVTGPEEWGWSGFFYSGYDQQYGQLHNYNGVWPDRAAHGNMDYSPYLLNEMRKHDLITGHRTIDVFTLHFYPQGGEFGDDVTTATQQLRNRSTRSLWDPSYTDESWIADKVMLIPRMKSWVSTYYPGTKIGLTEYNWGAEGSMNGATAQADIVGILGREAVDMATRWTTPDPSSPAYKAMKIYRNYDGSKSTFGDISVSAGGPNPDVVSAFASVRSSDKALTVMIVSKALTGNTPATIAIGNYAASGAAQRWQLASNAITHLADVALASNAVALSLPPQSITLLVIPGNTDVVAPALTVANGTASAAGVTLSGTASDNTAVTMVKWACSGATATSGTMNGTSSWSGTLLLNSGTTDVTISACDAAGNCTAQVVSVLEKRSLPVAPPTGRRRSS